MEVHWATDLKGEELEVDGVGIKENWIAYGNGHSLEAIYGRLCLVVHLDRFGERTTQLAIPENAKRSASGDE